MSQEKSIINNNDDQTSSDEDDEDYVPPNESQNDQSEESESGDDENDCLESDSTKVIETKVEENKINVIDENKLNKLWQEFHNDLSQTNKIETENKKCQETVSITKEYDFAGETVKVKEVLNKQKLTKEKNDGKSSSLSVPFSTTKRNSSNISSLLTQLKKPKMSTLKKSLLDWNEFKETNDIEEELDQHKRSKNSYLERQAFLSRTDLREFEHEKSVRDHERKIRDLKQNN